jgi:hypothetical protein
MDPDSVSVADEVAAPRLGRMSEPTLAAEIEPFDSFWEGPEEVERGYAPFHQVSTGSTTCRTCRRRGTPGSW